MNADDVFLPVAATEIYRTNKLVVVIMKKLFTWLRLRWRHRSHVPLYPDVWRRPDGVCVNDAGRVWDEFWQQPECPEKNRSRIGWAAFVAVVWGLGLGVNPARADFPTQVFFYATTNFNGMSGEAEACWSVYDDNQAPCMAVPGMFTRSPMAGRKLICRLAAPGCCRVSRWMRLGSCRLAFI